MSRRCRTYFADMTAAVSLPGHGSAVLRRCAAAAPITPALLLALFIFVSIIAAPLTVRAVVPAGTMINNTATATYTDGPSSASINRSSNTVTITTTAVRTPSKTEFLSYAPLAPGATPYTITQGAYRPDSNPATPFVPVPPPVASGTTTPLNLTKPVALVPATVYHTGEPIFVRITDPDQNVDPMQAETIVATLTDSVSSSTETILLTETGPNTGIFIGYIQSSDSSQPGSHPGTLAVTKNSSITAHYTDFYDTTDSSASASLIDPFGIIFDSSNGRPVNGATITLVDTRTSSPATVYGDDGVSTFPATVTTGATATDSFGRIYSFPAGGFRYPFVNPGTYRFDITPPTNYNKPSQVADAVLQTLPGGPFALTDGSRLTPFIINPGPALHIDIPVDPISTALWLQKSTDKNIVAIGDFLPYQLDLQNTDSTLVAPGVTIIDTLPLGFRYQKGSAKLNGASVPDPQIAADGRTLAFPVGDLAPTAAATIRFVVEVAAGAKLGTAVNQATAASSTGAKSNLATAAVQVRSDFMTSRSIIMGEMIIGPCDTPTEKTPYDLSGIRLFLEDGTYVLTDRNGMYHFEGVRPGTRVVQLDLDSIPKQYEMITCEENSRFARRNFSQFVDMQGGVLWRADFYLGLRPKVNGEVGLELISALPKESSATSDNAIVEYSIPIRIGAVPVRNLRLTAILADGLLYQNGSGNLNGKQLPEPSVMDTVVTFNLGDLQGNWEGTVRFKAAVPLTGAASALTTKALLSFDSPSKQNERTPLVDNVLARKPAGVVQPVSSIPVEIQPVEADLTSKGAGIDAELLMQAKTIKRTAMPEMILYPHFPTFEADLSDDDKRMIDAISSQLQGLEIENVTVIGHTDYVRIAPRSRHIYQNNNVLSKARATSVANYLIESLKLNPASVTMLGKGQTEPVADNRTSEGRARNRRVEVKIRTVKTVGANENDTTTQSNDLMQPTLDNHQSAPESANGTANAVEPKVSVSLVNEKERSGVKSVTTEGLRPGEIWVNPKTDKIAVESKNIPEYSVSWLKTAEPGSAWLWPPNGYNPPQPLISLAVKHDPSFALKLLLNGTEVDPITLDGTVKRDDNKLAVTTWHGVHLQDGDNTLVTIQSDGNGTETELLRRTIHYSTPPVKAALVPEKSKLLADGKTSPVIAIRLTDKDGHPAREALIVEFDMEPPFITQQRANELINAALPEASSGKNKQMVGEDGIVLIELQPTTRTEEAVLHLTLMNGREEVRARLKPEFRDWVLVGIAEGTAGYNNITGHMESASASGADDRFYDKERVAFYAKGAVKGEWLLTMAYDSAKQNTGVGGNSLFQTIDPNSYYTLYGDATSQNYDAASQKKLYLKIERDQFYALFGDFNSGLTVTELSRYSRSMTGLKSEYRSKDFDVTVFGSETAQSFVKDELRGDGTSGLYHLSKKGIVINSEKITIESHDRFHSEIITDTRQLSRFIDYSIDYDSGTIFFKSPVPNKDDKFNPVYIMVDYETHNAGKESLTYGGRAAAKMLNGKVEVGGTYVHEGQTNGDNNLYGADATAVIAPGTKARAEFATTNNNSAVKTSGNAYLAEVTHTGKQFDGKLYVREQQNGFGLGQQSSSEAGTRKYGVDTGYRLNEKVTLNSQAYRQYNLATGAVRDFMEAMASYNEKQYTLRSGLRFAKDSLPDNSSATSLLATVGGSWRTQDQKLTLRADHDQALFSKNISTDFPTRTIFGIDYQANKAVTLFAQEELTSGAAANTSTTTAGIKSTPWKGGSLNSSVVNDIKENDERTFANVGLTQKWQLTPKWAVDGEVGHSETIRKKAGYTTNTSVPSASGGPDFTAVSLGANFTEKKLLWSNRVEYRNSPTDDKWGLMSGLINEHGLNWGWTSRLQLYHTQSTGGNSSTTGDLRFGLAYRPPVTKWIVLNRLDLTASDIKSATSSATGKRLVNNLNANYKPNRKTQVSFQYGAKYVLDRIDAKDYSGYTDLIGIEGRYDITKEWDLGVRASLLHSWQTNQYAYSFGPSVGYNIMENAWISGGYNVAGFTDKDFSAANYTAQGPFIQYRFKFDQGSVKEGLKIIGQ